MSVKENIGQIRGELPQGVELVAVSKFHPVSAIMEAYEAGQRVFGENRPQELAAKAPGLPCDIRWHFIGHLQTNKLKQVLPYAHMVQSVDSLHLLEAMHAWLERNGRKMDCLLELHLGAEETKTGLTEEEIRGILAHSSDYPCLGFCGLMGMATNTDDEQLIRADFRRISGLWKELKAAHPELEGFRELSIGMSGDYRIALEYGATMVRIGTGIFGAREY
ncbi:MAG: YggS family pyridoxal phosphate-dependent enzyme [Candidatus Cryptobacteroides sp.]|nr:YggS family pyridoxal phosphate-dependent enzyme [Bacteroidales bacterium]MDD6053517.1 YggS family pyridoxal phosphate-dependent enzyme [Bacteroidales bacterium]